MKIDVNSLSKVEQVALVAGGLSILLSFFGSYVRVSYDGPGALKGLSGLSAGSSAWTSYATLGVLLIVAATAVVAIRAFASATLPANVPWNLVALAASALGTILLILRALTIGGSGLGISVGPGWSGWLLFVTTLVLTACTAVMFKNSGEKVPDFRGDNTPPSSSPSA